MIDITLNTDGGSRGNPGPGGIGVHLQDLRTSKEYQFKKYIGTTTNNQAEYQALIAGLAMTDKLAPGRVQIRMDSELIIKQLQGLYKVKDPKMLGLYNQVQTNLTKLISQGFQVEYVHVPRSENKVADKLVNSALDEQKNL